MPDNVTFQGTPATPPAGFVAATDDVAGIAYQRVKLVDGTADSVAAIPGDAANGLDVDVTRVSGVVHVDDNAGSLTVDAPVGTPLWVRLSDGAAAFVGQKAMAASIPVVVASDQSAIAVNDPGLPDTLGQKTMANSAGVAIASDQSVIPVSDNSGSLTVDAPVGTPVFARLSDGAAVLIGQKVMAGSLPVALASDQGVLHVDDNAGSLTVDAPVGTPAFARLSDGAAALIGQKTMAASLPVTMASDQSPLIVDGDVDHDAVNTLNVLQVGGHASPADNPPAAVSAVGDRARLWVDRFGAQVIRRRKIRESYTAVFRLGETAARLDQSFTQVANTNKQWCTIHHAATATKEIRLQKVIVYITGWITVAFQGIIELRELSSATAPATGNPAITPRARRIGTGAAEATCLYLPTIQGSEAAINSPLAHIPLDYGIMGGVSTVNPLAGTDQGPGALVLFDASREDDEVFQPVAPVGVYGGWAVMLRTVGAPVVRLTCLMVFTEEIP